jgi:adenosine deaminase
MSPVSSLQEYLLPWRIFKQLPVGRECLNEMVLAAFTALAQDDISYAELRNSPFNISDINNLDICESVTWLLDAFESARTTTGVDARIVLSITRHDFSEEHPETLLSALKEHRDSPLIVGVDISGDEDVSIASNISSLFRQAKDEYGLGVSIHAGETGSADNVLWALDYCKADRIGHGIGAASSPELLDRLRDADVCVEVCLISNLRSGRVPDINNHPVRQFMAHGVPFVLCSDNPAVHGAPLSADYDLFLQHFGDEQLIDEMFERQMRYSFCK